MSTMIYDAAPTRHHTTTMTALFALAFWALAAVSVFGAHVELDASSWRFCFAVKLAAIVVAGYAYVRFTAPGATLHHALGVGTVWLLLAVVTEVVMAEVNGRQWTELLGNPARPFLRNVMLFAWLVAPAIFARRDA
jgi:hypothetical protein